MFDGYTVFLSAGGDHRSEYLLYGNSPFFSDKKEPILRIFLLQLFHGLVAVGISRAADLHVQTAESVVVRNGQIDHPVPVLRR